MQLYLHNAVYFPKQNEEYKTHEQGYHQLSDSEPSPPGRFSVGAAPRRGPGHELQGVAGPGLCLPDQRGGPLQEPAHVRNRQLLG